MSKRLRCEEILEETIIPCSLCLECKKNIKDIKERAKNLPYYCRKCENINLIRYNVINPAISDLEKWKNYFTKEQKERIHYLLNESKQEKLT